ncbi:MAG TPA: hypothetical protein V6C58_02385 [Allocoleopsis sp.]
MGRGNYKEEFRNHKNKPEWIRQMKRYKKKFNLDIIFAIVNTKRFLKNSEKSEVWYNSDTHQLFDSEYFRKDILGSVSIKNLKCLKYENEDKFKLTYDFEHFISYSHGGDTYIDNICILNRGINRSKGNKELFILDFYEKEWMLREKTVSFDELLEELDSNLHLTCRKYDILFSKTFEGIWTIKSFTYNNEHRRCINYTKTEYIDEENHEIREEHSINLDISKATSVILGIGGKIVVAGLVVYIGYKTYRYFYPKDKK